MDSKEFFDEAEFDIATHRKYEARLLKAYDESDAARIDFFNKTHYGNFNAGEVDAAANLWDQCIESVRRLEAVVSALETLVKAEYGAWEDAN